MATNKTVPTGAQVDEFIEAVSDERRRRDCRELIELMRGITGRDPEMWGSSLVGFGRYRYRYESGREGEFFITGFSPRKTALTVYVMPGFSGCQDALERLGPHRTGKSCLYLKNLDAVDRDVLAEIIRDSAAVMRAKYECE